MKLRFKHQRYQHDAVEAVADCFVGQPLSAGVKYRIDPGQQPQGTNPALFSDDTGFRNADLAITVPAVLANIHAVQRRHNLPLSTQLVSTGVCPINLDVEMETGTGKTYCYIRTMFELHRRYGW